MTIEQYLENPNYLYWIHKNSGGLYKIEGFYKSPSKGSAMLISLIRGKKYFKSMTKEDGEYWQGKIPKTVENFLKYFEPIMEHRSMW